MPKENEWKRAENAENCILRTRLLFLLISYAFSRLLGIYRELIFHFEITLSKSMFVKSLRKWKMLQFLARICSKAEHSSLPVMS